MKETKIFELIKKQRLIPLITPDKIDSVLKVIKILKDISLPIAEITLRTDIALEAIRRAKKYYPGICIGSGTVMGKEDMEKAIEAGSDFIVTPGLDEQIIKWCKVRNKAIFPGVATPSEIQKAYNLGIKVMKFFPAEISGGVKMLQALNGPFGFYGIRFIPLGGITERNFLEYLKLDNVLAVGGSFIIDETAQKKGDFGEVKEKLLILREKLRKQG